MNIRHLKIRIEYVKAFQELNRAYESLVTYDDYNDDIVQSSTLNNQIQLFGRTNWRVRDRERFIDRGRTRKKKGEDFFQRSNFYSEKYY